MVNVRLCKTERLDYKVLSARLSDSETFRCQFQNSQTNWNFENFLQKIGTLTQTALSKKLSMQDAAKFFFFKLFLIF